VSLPFEPLEAAAREVSPDLTRALHISSTTLERYRNVGVTVEQADKLAVRIGIHPWWIWGDAFWEDLPEWVFGRLEGELTGTRWVA
jgi:hypothetical protein